MNTRTRTPIRAAAILGVLLAAGTSPATDPPPPTLADIGAAHLKHREAIRSFAVEYELQAKGLAEMPLLTQHLGTAYFVNERVVVAGKGELRYGRTVPKTDTLLHTVSPDRTIVYDGTKIKERRPMGKKGGQSMILVQAVRKENVLYFPVTYTSAICLMTPDPGEKEPGSVTARDRIPEVFKTAAFAVAPQPETVDGAACVVVAAAGAQKLWLDPSKGFAVRKRELYQDGEHTFTILCQEHEQVAPGVWLPRLVTWLSIGPKSAPEDLRGKPMLQTDARVRRLEVNRTEHDALFQVKVPPGSPVLDETLTGLDPTQVSMKGGNQSPTLSYVQPVNEADLESVISKAKAASDGAAAEGRRSRFLVINLILIGLVVTAVLGRKVYLQRRAAKSAPAGGEA